MPTDTSRQTDVFFQISYCKSVNNQVPLSYLAAAVTVAMAAAATTKTTLHVTQIVNKEQQKHFIPYKHGLLQVYNCKYPA